ncbi:TlpA family protein disulfide reductase [Flavobacterium kingsejongi]|uniref:Thioredoxin domain-containing protein n=1 Tax=Flavobacterium kingsejongi TaxID=1678728 RepID=A0A2S1LLT5_9FLAO|nr:TlpA disulfide reductase family protein [Flavobacterium kingsejongi]AWG24658.1 hypothetical protein FK004_05125 [Flavobacterium kingsejongi]
MKIRFLLLLMVAYSVPFYGQEKLSLETIIAQNKGKVILVDYWASWCKPCLKEMKKIPNIHQKYDGKDIVLVYLSIELDEKAWKKASGKIGISGDKYNLMTSKMNKTGTNKLANSAIPTYLIYNKKGELVNHNAPHPNEGNKLYLELDKYLNE